MKYFALLMAFNLFSSRHILGQNYIEYNLGVREAEALIVKEKYIEAAIKYEVAFKKVEYPFGRDYYNAALCWVKSDSVVRAFETLIKLANKGLDFKYIKRGKAFKNLKKNNYWADFLDSYKKKVNYFQSHKNQKFINEIDNLDIKDQFYRIKKGSYLKYGHLIKLIDKQNIVKLMSIIDSCGLPTEEMIGIKNKFEEPGYYIVLHHYCQQRSRDQSLPNIMEELHTSLNTGQIEPNTYSFLVSLQNDKQLPNYGNPAIYMFESEKKWRFTSLDDGKRELINKNRRLVGLESIDNFREKVLFSLHSKEFVFNITGSMSVFNLPKKSFGLFQNSTIIDEKNINN